MRYHSHRGLVQDRSIPSALAMEVMQSCTKPSICCVEMTLYLGLCSALNDMSALVCHKLNHGMQRGKVYIYFFISYIELTCYLYKMHLKISGIHSHVYRRRVVYHRDHAARKCLWHMGAKDRSSYSSSDHMVL